MLDFRSYGSSEVTQNNVESFQATFKNILALQNQLQTEQVFSDPKRVTKKFPALSAAVYKNMEIIGKKNAEKTVYSNMGKVCELQCENIETSCWYFTN